jgi:5-oxoprolinase (ATP-hydrolysing)
VEALSVEVVGDMPHPDEPVVRRTRYGPLARAATVRIYTSSAWWDADVFDREQIQPGDRVVGPAIIIEATATSIVEPGWRAEMTDRSHLVLTRTDPLPNAADTGTGCDPVMLEVLNGRFRSIAEQMGATLQNTSQSVNIKERLDFSCAIFDAKGRLVAAAHHIPVHLGSMSESVQALITERGGTLRPGDAYITNDPFRGGTHLPDITAITPVFDDEGRAILFFTASRGHHADIGGMSPGSMPPGSRTLDEEGVVIRNFLLLAQGRLQEQELLQLLSLGLYPARNPQQNLADLCAQAAANERGAQALRTMVQHFGLETVQVYMEYVQANAEDAVRRAIAGLAERGFSGHSQREYLDDGSCIQVTVTVDSRMRGARVDFTGTSPQQPGNFNAPAAVSRAAVLYVFRTLPAAPPATRHRGP